MKFVEYFEVVVVCYVQDFLKAFSQLTVIISRIANNIIAGNKKKITWKKVQSKRLNQDVVDLLWEFRNVDSCKTDN